MYRRPPPIIFVLAIALAIAAPAAAHNRIGRSAPQPIDFFRETASLDRVPLDDHVLLRNALEDALPTSEPIASLAETRIGAFELLAPFEREEKSELSRALRQGYEQLSEKSASDESFCAGDPINCSDPTGEFGWKDAKKLARAGVQVGIGWAKGKAQDAINGVVGIAQTAASPLTMAGTSAISAYTDAQIAISAYQANGMSGVKAASQQIAAWNKAESDRTLKGLVNLIPGVREYKHSKNMAASVAQSHYQVAGAELAHGPNAAAEDAATLMSLGAAGIGTASKLRSAMSFESAAAAGAEGFTVGTAESIQMLQPQIPRIAVNAQRGAAFEEQLLFEAQISHFDVETQLWVRRIGTGTRNSARSNQPQSSDRRGDSDGREIVSDCDLDACAKHRLP